MARKQPEFEILEDGDDFEVLEDGDDFEVLEDGDDFEILEESPEPISTRIPQAARAAIQPFRRGFQRFKEAVSAPIQRPIVSVLASRLAGPAEAVGAASREVKLRLQEKQDAMTEFLGRASVEGSGILKGDSPLRPPEGRGSLFRVATSLFQLPGAIAIEFQPESVAEGALLTALSALGPIFSLAKSLPGSRSALRLGRAMAKFKKISEKTGAATTARANRINQLETQVRSLEAFQRGEQAVLEAAQKRSPDIDLVRGRFFLGQQLAGKPSKVARKLDQARGELQKVREKPNEFLKEFLAAREKALAPKPVGPLLAKGTRPAKAPPVPPSDLAPPVRGVGAGPSLRATPVLSGAKKHTINLRRFENENTVDVIAELAKDPNFSKQLIIQRRGAIPRAVTKAQAAEQIRTGKITPEQFAQLRPGEQINVKQPQSVLTAAAKQIEETAAVEFQNTFNAFKAGNITQQEAAALGKNYVDVLIGADAVQSEAGRALGVLRRTTQQKAASRAAKVMLRQRLDEMDPGRFLEFMETIANLPANAVTQRRIATMRLMGPKNYIAAMIRELRGAILLTNPVTYLRNTVGNTIAMTSNMVEKPVVAGVDYLRASLTGSAQERFLGESMANAFGIRKGIRQAAIEALEVLKTENQFSARAITELRGAPAIPGQIGKAIRIPFRILGATDAFFESMLTAGELNATAYRIAIREGTRGAVRARRIQELLANPTDAMLDRAIKVAKEFTFKADLDQFTGALSKAINADNPFALMVKMVVPFFKTPVNLAKFAFARAPGSVLLRPDIIARGGPELSEAIAKNIVGGAALVLADMTLAYHEGLLTGKGPTNPVEREGLFATGWRPFSMEVGLFMPEEMRKQIGLQPGDPFYVPYQGFEPIAGLLRAVAEYAEISRDAPESTRTEKARQAMFVAIRGFTDQPFLQSVEELIKSWTDPERTGARFFARTVASFVPSGIAAIARETDPIVRDPEGVLEFVKTRIPGLSKEVRPRLSRRGEVIRRTRKFFGLIDIPGEIDALEAKLQELGLTRAIGRSPRRVFDRPLTKDQIAEISRAAGPGITKVVSALVNDKRFQELPRAIQFQQIQRAVNRIRTTVRQPTGLQAELGALGIQIRPTGNQAATLLQIIQRPDYGLLNDDQRKQLINEILLRGPQ